MHLGFLPFDPAWVTIIIRGLPLLYLAIWKGDVLRPEAKDMVSRLNAMHTSTVLLTGDNKKTAESKVK